MIIRRIQVEGGFLDSLDLRFEEGLNVLIGGRGTGKSSIIELIRYCLGVRGYSDEQDKQRSLEQALSVLQDGQVTLDLQDGENAYSVTRVASFAQSEPEGLDPTLLLPLIFSQKDVESVGLSVRGRLSIVDFFSRTQGTFRSQERRHSSQIVSLTTEIGTLIREADALSERLSGATSIREELTRAEARAAEFSKSSSELENKQKKLDLLADLTAAFAVRGEFLRRASETVAEYLEGLSGLRLFGFAIEEWPDATQTEDLLRSPRKKLATAEQQLDRSYVLVSEAFQEIEAALKELEREKAPVEEQARTIRREIEGLKEGAGAAARQLAGIREQLSQLDALRSLQKQKLERIKRLQRQRDSAIDELEQLRDRQFEERTGTAARLTSRLGPSIRVRIRQAAQVGEFAGAIANGLKGSGLRYNELSSNLASRMSPRELVTAVENFDDTFIARAANISAERSSRVISQLRESGLESVVAISLGDVADFELLDGRAFKPMDALSVGQRCTVVLSILLQHEDRVLIVDQPEDHLDNAFIADTLIEAIRARAQQGQLIFSTHNANIPVLGEAAQVVRLGSDGKRGFVVNAEPLDHPKSVEAITKIMEGGKDAFRKRASFYQRYSNE
ncbi:AAA family ATPase [Frankia sp. RB7]|nr:AAA family ATPase [Frankia sp. RB7]